MAQLQPFSLHRSDLPPVPLERPLSSPHLAVSPNCRPNPLVVVVVGISAGAVERERERDRERDGGRGREGGDDGGGATSGLVDGRIGWEGDRQGCRSSRGFHHHYDMANSRAINAEKGFHTAERSLSDPHSPPHRQGAFKVGQPDGPLPQSAWLRPGEKPVRMSKAFRTDLSRAIGEQAVRIIENNIGAVTKPDTVREAH